MFRAKRKRNGFLSGRTSMRTHLLRLAIVSITVVACCSLPVLRADDEDIPFSLPRPDPAFKRAVLLLADVPQEDPTKPIRLLPGEAAVLTKKGDLDDAMRLFKPKNKNGLGIGDLTRAGHKAGIELLIRDYASRPPTDAEVTRHHAELQRVGRITLVIAEIMPHYAPQKDLGSKGPTDWRKRSGEMKKGALNFLDAVGAKDPRLIAEAAKRLNNTCVECHKLYRDDE
jgi:hypothetical protein